MATDALLIATMHHRRTVLAQALERAGWSLTVYEDVAQALDHIRHHPYAAVFCDEYLRGASAGGFLAWSRRTNPKAPFYVIAMRGEKAALAAGHRPSGVIAFPPDDEGIPRPPTHSLPNLPPTARRDLPLEGTTGLVQLADLVEMLALGGSSAVVSLADGDAGRIYLANGQLEHAIAVEGDLQTVGIRGLARLLDLPATPFGVLPYRSPSRRTIHVSTTAALAEAMQLIDEGRRDRSVVAAVASAVETLGIAAGYLLNDAPTEAQGDGVKAFAKGVALIEALQRSSAGVTHLAVETEEGAYAAVVYGDGHVVTAYAKRGRSMLLLTALAKAVKAHAG
jgi:CheY-like chemotaxis protein